MSTSLTENPVNADPLKVIDASNPNDRDSLANNRSQQSISSDESSCDGDDDGSDDDEESPLSLEELLYSASSYHAIARPVSLTMILAALAAVYVNDNNTLESGAKEFASAYQVWQVDSGDNTGKNLAISVGNTLIMVSVIATMTFGIVLLYKYRCMKCLIGYMILSSASLLGLLGDYMATIAIEIYRIPIDILTYYSSLYNFAIVGVIAIFYQKGVPSPITQMYLIFTSVILAWHLSHFDEWTAWTLLVMLALYDLCAVLTPCGPLKALVNLMQEEDSPEMPGLLYEAQLPAGTQRPGATNNNSSVDISAHNPDTLASTSSSHTNGTTILTKDIDSSQPNYDDNPVINESTSSSGLTRRRRNTICSSDGSLVSCASSTHDEIQGTFEKTSTTSSSPLTNSLYVTLPLAIAKVYKLKLVSNYGTSNTSAKSQKQRSNINVNLSPLLADWEQSSKSVEFYNRDFSVRELMSSMEVEMPRNGGRIEIRGKNRSGELRYAVLNRHGELKRILTVNRKGKVYQLEDDEYEEDDESMVDDSSSIRLGLGDFIFYSVLVAKAALYSFTTFAACILVILAGLGGTLVILSVYRSALPALPISIFLGVVFYLFTRLFIEPWIEVVMATPLYV